MALKEITPHHLRCGLGQCPAVYEHGSQDLIIIGKIPDRDTLAQIAGKVGRDEYAIRISREMLSSLKDRKDQEP